MEVGGGKARLPEAALRMLVNAISFICGLKERSITWSRKRHDPGCKTHFLVSMKMRNNKVFTKSLDDECDIFRYGFSTFCKLPRRDIDIDSDILRRNGG